MRKIIFKFEHKTTLKNEGLWSLTVNQFEITIEHFFVAPRGSPYTTGQEFFRFSIVNECIIFTVSRCLFAQWISCLQKYLLSSLLIHNKLLALHAFAAANLLQDQFQVCQFTLHCSLSHRLNQSVFLPSLHKFFDNIKNRSPTDHHFLGYTIA